MGAAVILVDISHRAILQIFTSLYAIFLESLESQSSSTTQVGGKPGNIHYCSLQHPCTVASALFSPIYQLRLVSKDWDACFLLFCSAREHKFFRRVEEAYYPHAWHINSKIRKAVLLGRYRIFNTIDTEDGERGVFQAFDFKASQDGCSGGRTVIVKGWLNAADGDCVTEGRVYEILRSKSVKRVPALLAYAFDNDTEVHALVIEKLGPTLEDLLDSAPGRKLEERFVLALAIQAIDCYADLHGAGIIHNGVKPGNICMSSEDKRSIQTRLSLIDFGLSYFHDLDTGSTLPAPEKFDAVGNRQFLSIYGHHGISQSQRDDLESLGYLFSFLYHGYLPWDRRTSTKSINSKSRVDNKTPAASAPSSPTPHIWCIKMATPGSVLFRDMDHSFLQYWKDVKSLAFGEKPDYALLKSLFVECWQAKRLGGIPGEVDWFGFLKTGKERDT